MTQLAQQCKGMRHIALELTDLAEGERFFGELFGCKERFRTTFQGSELVMLAARSAEIEMWQRKEAGRRPAPERSALHHIAFGVKDLDSAMAAVESLCVPVLVEPYEPTRGIREAIIEGPDGLRVQLVQRNLALLIWRSLRGEFC